MQKTRSFVSLPTTPGFLRIHKFVQFSTIDGPFWFYVLFEFGQNFILNIFQFFRSHNWRKIQVSITIPFLFEPFIFLIIPVIYQFTYISEVVVPQRTRVCFCTEDWNVLREGVETFVFKSNSGLFSNITTSSFWLSMKSKSPISGMEGSIKNSELLPERKRLLFFRRIKI